MGIVCPATRSQVRIRRTNTIQGVAGRWGRAQKIRKYQDVPGYVPFIMETGGLIDGAAIQWLEALVTLSYSELPEGSASQGVQTVTRGILNSLGTVLCRKHARMMHRVLLQINRRRARRQLQASNLGHVHLL